MIMPTVPTHQCHVGYVDDLERPAFTGPNPLRPKLRKVSSARRPSFAGAPVCTATLPPLPMSLLPCSAPAEASKGRGPPRQGANCELPTGGASETISRGALALCINYSASALSVNTAVLAPASRSRPIHMYIYIYIYIYIYMYMCVYIYIHI